MRVLGNLNKKKIAAGVVCILMIAAVLFSAFYISAESGHDCTGDNCPICACICQCEKTLHQMGDGTPVMTVAAIPVILYVLKAFFAACELLQDTPVSEKVRLND